MRQAPWYMKLIGAMYEPFAREVCEVGRLFSDLTRRGVYDGGFL